MCGEKHRVVIRIVLIGIACLNSSFEGGSFCAIDEAAVIRGSEIDAVCVNFFSSFVNGLGLSSFHFECVFGLPGARGP